jgi:hypothetical protein
MAVIEIDMTGIDGPKYQAIEASMAEWRITSVVLLYSIDHEQEFHNDISM